MIVCVCNAIRETQVRQAAREGASCPTSAYRCYGAKPRCGQCFTFARDIIAAERSAAAGLEVGREAGSLPRAHRLAGAAQQIHFHRHRFCLFLDNNQ